MATNGSAWQAWALGLFVTLAGAFGTYAWTDVKADVADLNGLRERVTVVEVRQSEIQRQYLADIAEIKERLQRIDQQQLDTLKAIASRR